MKLPFPRFDAELVHSIEDYLDMHRMTQIVNTEAAGDGLHNLHSEGRWSSGAEYIRPMFQLIGIEHHGFPVLVDLPCAACYDFSRTADCPDHPDPGIPHQLKEDAEPQPGRYTQLAVEFDAAITAQNQMRARLQSEAETLAWAVTQRALYIGMASGDGSLSWRVSGS